MALMPSIVETLTEPWLVILMALGEETISPEPDPRGLWVNDEEVYKHMG